MSDVEVPPKFDEADDKSELLAASLASCSDIVSASFNMYFSLRKVTDVTLYLLEKDLLKVVVLLQEIYKSPFLSV